MYKTIRVNTFKELATELINHQHIAAQIYSHSESWGYSIAKRVQSIYLEQAEQTGGSPMSASFDGFEILEDSGGFNLFKFSLADVQNKSLIHHAKLTRFKEEEV